MLSHACFKNETEKNVRSYIQHYTRIKYESVYRATCVTRVFLKCHSNWLPSKIWVANWQFWSLIFAVEEHRCHFSSLFKIRLSFCVGYIHRRLDMTHKSNTLCRIITSSYSQINLFMYLSNVYLKSVVSSVSIL